jgi:hypothetical protein
MKQRFDKGCEILFILHILGLWSYLETPKWMLFIDNVLGVESYRLVLVIVASEGMSCCVAFSVQRCLFIFHVSLPRYLDIMVSEGLEITQPALDPDLSTDIHHRITIRNKMTKVHRCSCLSNSHIPRYDLLPYSTLSCALDNLFTVSVGEYTTIVQAWTVLMTVKDLHAQGKNCAYRVPINCLGWFMVS